MMFFLFSVSLSIILIFLLHKAKMSRTTFLPPGPVGLPFIGNLHQYDSLNPHIYFRKLSKKYGKIFSLKIGSATMVVISSAKLAKEVTQIQDLTFCSRPAFLGRQKISYNGHDIAFAPYSDYWREMRKVCVVHLLSLKKVQSFRSIREDEVSRMIKKISQQITASQIINMSNILITLTRTITCRIAFGIRYDEEAHEKRKFDELLTVTQDMMHIFFSLIIFLCLVGLINYLEIFKNLTRISRI
ncbi:hypothetical protein MTR67_003490 [Solanum verrucosum]|uniref:Cytochrome P450 n=1 Tax=Solanum verrucosum TaxID=315347 RepID=A0AAF0TE59_SOLVR|nr:hypothetical protein MTR67_003490 [Solanum verrucosum]